MTNGKYYKPERYRQILDKMLIMTLLSEHSLSFSDIDNMPLLDRDYLYDRLVERNEAIKKKMEESRAKRESAIKHKH